jgi:hypothetical protein
MFFWGKSYESIGKTWEDTQTMEVFMKKHLYIRISINILYGFSVVMEFIPRRPFGIPSSWECDNPCQDLDQPKWEC